jgi:DNA-binding NtrC family response regulator
MIGQYSKKMNKPLIELTDSDISMINSYNWPGNVRELQNLIERGIIVSKDGSIQWDSIIPNAKTAIQSNEVVSKDIIYTTDDLVEIERENIIKALKKTNWRISGKNGAATLLKMPSTTLASKLKSLGIKRPV